MTYNFDPDKWYEDEAYILNLKLMKGEITQDQYDELILVITDLGVDSFCIVMNSLLC